MNIVIWKGLSMGYLTGDLSHFHECGCDSKISQGRPKALFGVLFLDIHLNLLLVHIAILIYAKI